MTGDKEKLQSYNALEKEKKVSFGNDTPTVIKCKGFVLLKEKVKAGNVLWPVTTPLLILVLISILNRWGPFI